MTERQGLMNVQRLIDYTLENGGGTFTKDGAIREYGNGYMVGVDIPTIIVPLNNLTEIEQAIERMAEDTPYHIGTWVHDGNVYIDAARHIELLAVAEEVAQARGELAIWDCAALEEIAINTISLDTG